MNTVEHALILLKDTMSSSGAFPFFRCFRVNSVTVSGNNNFRTVNNIVFMYRYIIGYCR